PGAARTLIAGRGRPSVAFTAYEPFRMSARTHGVGVASGLSVGVVARRCARLALAGRKLFAFDVRALATSGLSARLLAPAAGLSRQASVHELRSCSGRRAARPLIPAYTVRSAPETSASNVSTGHSRFFSR